MKILILNCGSSSVKYKLFQMPGEEILSEGIIERIGFSNSRLKFIDHACNEIVTEKRIHDHDEAIRIILNALTDKKYGYLKDLSDLDAVGHRVAHGGDSFRDSTLINNLIFTKIQEYSDLAPLHNPNNLKGIEAIRKQLPGIKQVAVFDTAFHHTLPEYAYTYAIPYELSDKYKIRRYGFHGTSHSYVSRRACEILNRDITKQRIITCHLGNGSSIAAIAGGKSIDTSMGFTPMEGLIMGTRPGDLDVGILPFIMKKENIDCEAVTQILNEKSGLLGISGISSDMREIEASVKKDENPRAKLSLEMYFYRLRKYIGAYAAVLNGLDILVITGGIGENCRDISTGLCHGLDYLGLEIEDEKAFNLQQKEMILSTESSRVTAMIIPTNEELVIAEETWDLISNN